MWLIKRPTSYWIGTNNCTQLFAGAKDTQTSREAF